MARLSREMDVIGRLDYSDIVQTHDVGEDDGVHYRVMEFVLQKIVSQLRIAHDRACELARQTAVNLNSSSHIHVARRYAVRTNQNQVR